VISGEQAAFEQIKLVLLFIKGVFFGGFRRASTRNIVNLFMKTYFACMNIEPECFYRVINAFAPAPPPPGTTPPCTNSRFAVGWKKNCNTPGISLNYIERFERMY